MTIALASKPKEKSKPAALEREADKFARPENEFGGAAGMPLFMRGQGIQTKLTVGQPNDPFEQEADLVARAARDGGSSRLLRVGEPAPLIQRACAECASGEQVCPECERERELEAAPPVQTKPALHSVPPSSTSTEITPPDTGAPLAPPVRARLEPMLGADLGSVRIHSSAAARQTASALDAKAFTHKQDIWLGANASADDIELMAHEAAHVVQQTRGNAKGLVQRAPADYRHPEDGGNVHRRMQQRIDKSLDQETPEAESGGEGTTAEPGNIPPPSRGVDARRAAQQIDRGELAEERAELEPEAKPDVDRPAQEQPRVEQAAQETTTEADAPSEPLAEAEEGAEGKAEEGKKKRQAEAVSAAELAAGLANQAFATADSQPIPTPEMPVTPPELVAPVDAAGMPLPDDPETDMQLLAIADRAQMLREEGLRLRMQATQERQNAEILRGNLELIRGGITQAEQGVTKSNNHLAFRQEIAGQAREALAVSEQKAATVAEQAPDFVSKADEGKEDSGPMASEASELAAENSAQTPDDEEAAARAQEQGGKMTQAGSDIQTTDDAVTQTRTKAASLGEEAAQAQELNTQTQGKLDTMDETLSSTAERLGEMGQQNSQARDQVDALAAQPDRMAAQAQTLDEQASALIQASYDIQNSLQQTQTSYAQGMRSVPALVPVEPGQEAVVQRQPESGTATAIPPVPSTAAAAEGAPAAGAPPQPEERSVGDILRGTGRYEERVNLNLGGAVGEALPGWLTGVTPESEQQRQARQQAEQQRRRDQVQQINAMADGHFENLSATDKMGIALQLTGQNLFRSASGIKWPGWGHLAAGLIDPRGPLMGVVSGLSMTLSGAANLLSAEQWRRDPLGNLLKSAADIATGLTIILGSITALAAVIIAIMVAITILSFGTAAPVTGPVIAFCTTVMTTVGGWTIAVGKVALILQALVLIKNLIDAATAKTAEDLQNQADQMTEDVSNAGNVVLQMGMAKLAQVGGRAMAGEIQAAGGGVRFAAQMGARGLPARIAAGVRGQGVGGFGRQVAAGAGQRIAGGFRYLATTSVTEAAGGARAALGRAWRGLTQPRGAPVTGREGLSREFLVGKEIPRGGSYLSSARGIVAEERAAAEAAFGVRPGAPRAGEPVPEAPPRPNEPPTSPSERALLEETRLKSGRDLTPDEIRAELDMARRAEPRPISEGPYVEEVRMPNGHTWRRTRDGKWCRFSNGGLCVTDISGTPKVVEEPKTPTTQEPTPTAPEPTPAPTAPKNRYEVKSVSDVERLRSNPPAKPSGLTAEQEAAWQRYMDYYRKRLDDLEAELRANPTGTPKTEPPRSWESYQDMLKLRAKFEGGTEFQKEFSEALAKERPGARVDENLGVAKTSQETTKYADQFAYDPKTRQIEAFSNKSREFGALKDWESTVEADVREALNKYGGTLEVRRPGHPLFGQKVVVKKITLVYDSRLVPQALRDQIVRVAADKAITIFKSYKLVVRFFP